MGIFTIISAYVFTLISMILGSDDYEKKELVTTRLMQSQEHHRQPTESKFEVRTVNRAVLSFTPPATERRAHYHFINYTHTSNCIHIIHAIVVV